MHFKPINDELYIDIVQERCLLFKKIYNFYFKETNDCNHWKSSFFKKIWEFR